MASTFFFSDSPFTVTSADTVITSSSFGGRFSTLTSFQLGNEVTSIDGSAFSLCTALTSITIPNSVTSIGGSAFYGCTNLASVTIGSGVTSIGNSAFAFCTNLATVVINGNNLTVIDGGAFYGPNSLTKITIPKSVTFLGVSAFRYNANLIRVNFLGNAPSIDTLVFDGTSSELKIYRYSTKSGWSSTFGGRDVLLIDSGTRGLRSFGFGSSSSGQASVKKTNIGSGRLTLSKFDPRNISNLEYWTSQGNLNYVNRYVIISLQFDVNYFAGDLDTVYFVDDPITPFTYTGVDFGSSIQYDAGGGNWYLYDPDGNEIGFSEDLLAGSFKILSLDLDYFDLNSYDTDSYTSANTFQFTWSNLSGNVNNSLITKPNPFNAGIISASIKNLDTKQMYTPFRTSNQINLLNPFTIYMALVDVYTGTDTRYIFGLNGLATSNYGVSYSFIYLESTTNIIFHTFTLKFFNGSTTSTICSFNVPKTIFASTTFGPSILKLSSTYDTTSGSQIRRITLSYYNSYSDTSKTLGSLSATGTALINTPDTLAYLYIGHNSFGNILGLAAGNVPYLSEVVIYNKFLNATEDASINRYLQRKYYGKLLS